MLNRDAIDAGFEGFPDAVQNIVAVTATSLAAMGPQPADDRALNLNQGGHHAGRSAPLGLPVAEAEGDDSVLCRDFDALVLKRTR